MILRMLLLSAAACAWPFDDLRQVLRRQDGRESRLMTAPASTANPNSTTSTASPSSKSATKSQPTNIDPRLPAGGVNMITPSALATSTYYKIGGDPLSFAWNYTSLSVAPTAVDVLVTCTANQATYTVASNVSFESTGSAVWDTKPEITGTAPLLSETYTLIIHDASKAVTDIAKAGFLGSYNQFSFGMYQPQKYVSLADGWTCASCSAAGSDIDRHALKFMLAMCGITVLSFTWFVSGLGL